MTSYIQKQHIKEAVTKAVNVSGNQHSEDRDLPHK